MTKNVTENFWKELKTPIFALAPMADVTDAAFRRVIAKYGKPDVIWTEFVSADGLSKANERGREKLLEDLIFTETERPIVAQFFTASPREMHRAAHLSSELGFDGVDINMGCPDRSIEKQGAGAALIKNSTLAVELIEAAKEGVESSGRGIPVSVKTRIGYDRNELDTWAPALLEAKPSAIIFHMRTRREMSNVPAHWECVSDIVEMRNSISPETLILGNGDVSSLDEARLKVSETGCDGAMFGRAIFGNPWFFSERVPEERERLEVLVEHAKLFEELLPHKSFAVMKKHFKAYVSGWKGAKELRIRLMECETENEVESEVSRYLSQATGSTQ